MAAKPPAPPVTPEPPAPPVTPEPPAPPVTPEPPAPPEVDEDSVTEAIVPVFDMVRGVCSQCGDHARTDLRGRVFCPEHNADCPRYNKEAQSERT